jgi:hypothetical protein
LSEAPVGLTIMEKLFGLILIAIGAITFYVTFTNLDSAIGNPLFFLAGALVLVIIGLFLLIASPE